MTDLEQPSLPAGVFGIDLGTTYSAVGYTDAAGRVMVTRNGRGEHVTPSVVYFESNESVIVGRPAKDAAGLFPDQVVSLIKREMGNREYRRTFFGVEYTPQAISAIILQALTRAAEEDTGRKVSDVVITVPAYFGLLEKDATRQAGEIAGLNVVGILPEPVAAALGYGVSGSADGTTFLIYDLGGDTFDVSLIRMTDVSVEVLAVGGDYRLGGADWDEKLLEHLVEQIIVQCGDDSLLDDEPMLHDLRILAEETKKALSSAETKTQIVRYTGTPAEITTSRAQFERLTADLLGETIRITERMLDEAEEKYPGIRQQISEVLVVGGSSKMPAVTAGLAKEFGWPLRLADPDLVTAKGATLYGVGQTVRHVEEKGNGGQSVTGRSGEVPGLLTEQAVRAVSDKTGLSEEYVGRLAQRTVVNVLPKAIGIKVADPSGQDLPERGADIYYVEHLLHANEALPAAHHFYAATVQDGQESVELSIYEQSGVLESPRLADNHQVIVSRISGIPPLPAGTPIDITISVDEEGLLSLTAVEHVSGKKLEVDAPVRVPALRAEEVAEARMAHRGLTVSAGQPAVETPAPAPAWAGEGESADRQIADSFRITGAGQRLPPGARFGDEPDDVRATDVGVSRARYLAADLPERAPAGARVSLLVRIVLAPPSVPSSAPTGALKSFAIPYAGAKVTISVSAPGLVALGDLEQEVLVPAHADSEQVRFGFRAGAVGLQTITVRAFAGGTFLGELLVQMSVELGAELEEGPTRKADIGPAVAEPGEVTLQVSRDGDLYSFQLISETWYPAQLSGRLAGDPAEAVEALVAELRGMAAGRSSYASPKLVRARLRNLGAQLWADAVPEAIRRQFWEQADRIASFSVASDLDNIPWELLYPVDGDNELGFLCEHYPLTRRVYGQGRTRTLPLSSVAYVVPRGSPDDAMDEVTRVRARLGAQISDQGVLDNLQDLTALLDGARTSVLHFACHNRFTSDDGSVVAMADGPFRPSDLSLAVQRKALASSGPLVFLNGCRSAGEIPGFTKMMGWAKQFMGAGAGAFLGSLWPVRSSSARDFADAFYAAFAVDQQPLGEATQKARKAIAEEVGDPTWLAYTVYGNPAATAGGNKE